MNRRPALIVMALLAGHLSVGPGGNRGPRHGTPPSPVRSDSP